MVRVGFPKQIPGIQNVAIGRFLRDAAGNQAVTGLGFVPRVIIFFAVNLSFSTNITSDGVSNQTENRCFYHAGHLTLMSESLNRCVWIQVDATNYIRGYVASLDADGFTVTWELTGSVTAAVIYLAMR